MTIRNYLPLLVFVNIFFVGQINAEKCALKCLIPIDVDLKCGSNGVTYQNMEELECAKSLCYPDLLHSHNGSCETAITLLLGTNKKPKEIQFKPKKPNRLQIAETVKNEPIPPTPTAISATISPAKFIRRPLAQVLGRNTLSPSNCNSLDDCTCDYILYPVCGTNGITYGNSCVLDCAKKCDSGLSVHHFGFCGRIFFTQPLPQLKFFKALTPKALSNLERSGTL